MNSETSLEQDKLAIKRLRVAAYIRVSTNFSNQENSFETQREYFTNLITANKDWCFAGLYSDYGASGTSIAKRVGFRELLRHCREGKIDRILCKSISRFARNASDFLTVLRQLKEVKVTILFEKEGLDTANTVNEFIFSMLAAFAQEESRSISENIKLGQRMHYPKGEVRNYAIYGYRYVPKVVKTNNSPKFKAIEIVPEEAVVVQRIFAMAHAGKTSTDISEQLNLEHVPGPATGAARRKCEFKSKNANISTDAGWTPSRISSILKNERYIGDVMIQKSHVSDYLTHRSSINQGEAAQFYVKNHHPAIVCRSIFNEVQRIRCTKSAYNISHRSKQFFTKRLICGNCGRYLNLRRNNGNPIWYCPTTRRGIAGHCSNSRIYEKQVTRALQIALSKKNCLAEADFLYDKSFLSSVTVYNEFSFIIHWIDGTHTESIVKSCVRDARFSADYYDGFTMRDSIYRKRTGGANVQ